MTENNKKPGRPRKNRRPVAQTGVGPSRTGYPPDGDRRLLINIREDLHIKLKLAAVNQGTTMRHILEDMLTKNFQ